MARPRLAVVVLLGALAGLLLGWPPPAAADTGPWTAPLRPADVVRGFDPPATPYTAGHRGVDLAGRDGQAVHAAGAGVVSFAGRVGGKPVVTVTHGSLRTTYEPVVATVRRGERVAAGALIGHLAPGHAGCGGACLHWGLLRGDVYLDPLALLDAGVLRLLPVIDAGRAQARVARDAPPVAGTTRAHPDSSDGGSPTRIPVAGIVGGLGLAALTATAAARDPVRRRRGP